MLIEEETKWHWKASCAPHCVRLTATALDNQSFYDLKTVANAPCSVLLNASVAEHPICQAPAVVSGWRKASQGCCAANDRTDCDDGRPQSTRTGGHGDVVVLRDLGRIGLDDDFVVKDALVSEMY
jgi:hypothetical protein